MGPVLPLGGECLKVALWHPLICVLFDFQEDKSLFCRFNFTEDKT
jgi:hypothetical protein